MATTEIRVRVPPSGPFRTYTIESGGSLPIVDGGALPNASDSVEGVAGSNVVYNTTLIASRNLEFVVIDGPDQAEGDQITILCPAACAEDIEVRSDDFNEYVIAATDSAVQSLVFTRRAAVGEWWLTGGGTHTAGDELYAQGILSTNIPGSPTPAAGAGGGSDLGSAAGLNLAADNPWWFTIGLHIAPGSDAVVTLRVVLENEDTLTRYECVLEWDEFVSPESGPYSRTIQAYSNDSGGAPDGTYTAYLQATANASGVAVPVSFPSSMQVRSY